MARPRDAIQIKLSDLIGPAPPAAQVEFVTATEREVCWISGFGGGKTVGLAAKCIKTMLEYPGSVCMIGRRTYDELRKTTKKTFFRVADPLAKAGLIDRPRNWDPQEKTEYLRLTTGAELYFTNLDDETKFKNLALTWVGIDQAEENEWDLVAMLNQRLRPEFRAREVPLEARQLCLIANDEGRNWLWERYVPQAVGYVKGRRFIHSTSFDNPYLSKEYLADLLRMPSEWQDKYVFAKLRAGSGRLLPDPVTIPRFRPPPHWPVYRGIDHGESSVCSAHWGTVNPDPLPYQGVPGRGVCVFQEYWQEASDVEHHARAILGRSEGYDIVSTVLDRRSFSLTQSRRGGLRSSIADLYAECGLVCAESAGDPETRVERITLAQSRGLVVTEECVHYLHQAPKYHTKLNRRTGLPEIVNRQRFHAVDSVGFLLMAMPLGGPVGPPPDPDAPPAFLRPDHPYWLAARDEASRQFALANYRDRRDETTEPYGGALDGFFDAVS